MKTSVPQYFKTHHPDYCLYGNHWIWDQVEFSFLYPTISQLGLGNNSSCVLKISNGKHSILLTGDIEKKAEKFLIKFARQELLADLMIAPHHGSKTSAMKDFIQSVHPKNVLFPIGYFNRYHFPHAKVIQEYIDQKIIMHDTVQSGAIQIRLNDPLSFEFYRLTHVKLWNSGKMLFLLKNE
jgi:competence protein ComEC